MPKKFMTFEVKEISAEGSFEGLLSPYGPPADSYGDVVERGAYVKTIKEHGNTVPMLWQHKTDSPIGELTLEDRPDGLWCKGQLLMPLADAQKAHLLIKARIVRGLSIGYEAIKDAVESGVRHLKEIRLYEGSIVTFPASLQALITSVKAGGETKDDFTTELAEVQLQDMGYQIFCALRCALGSLPWASGMSREEKVAAAEVSIQQFSETFLTYLPLYIDYLAAEYGGMETMSAAQREAKSKKTFEPRVEQTAVEPTERTEVTLSDLSKAIRDFIATEAKAGRTISQATKTTISTVTDQMQSGMDAHKSGMDSYQSAYDLLLALISDEAVGEGDKSAADTSEQKAAALPKSEPVAIDHSAAKQILEDIRSLFRAA